MKSLKNAHAVQQNEISPTSERMTKNSNTFCKSINTDKNCPKRIKSLNTADNKSMPSKSNANEFFPNLTYNESSSTSTPKYLTSASKWLKSHKNNSFNLLWKNLNNKSKKMLNYLLRIKRKKI